MNPEMLNPDERVVFSILKLSRAMRRCPPPRGELPFPPAVGRLLECVSAAPGVSSRELCEALDLRPSSLSEILARAEGEGLLTRAVDEEDRRVLHISLTEKGRSVVREMETARGEDAKKKASCLTEEEKRQFCSLCEKLSVHIESLALELPEGMTPPPDGWEPHGRPPRPEDGPRRNTRPGRPPLPPGGRFRC